MKAIEQLIEQLGSQTSLIGRGLGRSYGDAACNPEGVTILTERLNRLLAFDQATGVLKAEAGVSFGDLLEIFVPRGWMLPVVPGTKFVSLGGALAANIHGKNHHIDGSFSRHVNSFALFTGQENLLCSPQSNAEAFWATAGGMGLTGVISDIELRLQRISSSYIKTRYLPAESLDVLMDSFAQHEADHQFSVAWIDCFAAGKGLGRGVLMLGDFAQAHELPQTLAGQPLAWPSQKTISIPVDLPEFVLNRLSVMLFNELFYRAHASSTRLIHADKFFFPLDSISNFNRLYGKRGFVQYQCVLPPETSAAGVRRILMRCVKEGWGSFLAVLKRFGPEETESARTLSFPHSGYTLALDFAVKPHLLPFLQELDQIVLESGGRVYLAKDACLPAETFRCMYPHWQEWKAVRDRLDPQGCFSTALSKRLGLA